jgi:hypothetical protein
MSYKLILFIFLFPLYIFWIYNVFINKVCKVNTIQLEQYWNGATLQEV